MTDDTYALPQEPAEMQEMQKIPGLAARRLPYSHSKRVTYGILWAGWTANAMGFRHLGVSASFPVLVTVGSS